MDSESEDRLYLNDEGAEDVAAWFLAARRAGHFDWQKLCVGNEPENIAERWRLVSWLNEEKLLDGPLGYIEDVDDREICAAMMLSFLFNNIESLAGETPVEEFLAA